MRRALLYVLAAALVVGIVAMAWYTREAELPQTYQVRPGDTDERIAETFQVELTDLMMANPEALADGKLEAGELLEIPRNAPTGTDLLITHAAGAAAELAGVLIAVWLAMAGGVVARVARRQVAGIAMVLALVSYISGQVAATAEPLLTVRFVFDAFQDGFFWAALFVLIAQVLRMRDAVPRDDALPVDDGLGGPMEGPAAS